MNDPSTISQKAKTLNIYLCNYLLTFVFYTSFFVVLVPYCINLTLYTENELFYGNLL